MNKQQIENLKKNLPIYICEKLPYNLTLYQENGSCQKTTPSCKYYETKTSLCKKETLTPISGLVNYLAI